VSKEGVGGGSLFIRMSACLSGYLFTPGGSKICGQLNRCDLCFSLKIHLKKIINYINMKNKMYGSMPQNVYEKLRNKL